MATQVKKHKGKATKKPVKKAVKKAPVAKAKSDKKIAVKTPTKKAAKSPAKKVVTAKKKAPKKAPVAKAKSPAKVPAPKAVKAAPLKSPKVAQKRKSKVSAKNAPKSTNGINTQNKSKPNQVKEAPVTTQKTHGRDMHFIPTHHQETPQTIHDSIKEEKLFHHDELVAVNQENANVKADMASRMGNKRIFRNRGGV